MKAEDTVLNILEIDNITGDEAPCSNCPTPDGDCTDCHLSRVAQKQAMISFKAGYGKGKLEALWEVNRSIIHQAHPEIENLNIHFLFDQDYLRLFPRY